MRLNEDSINKTESDNNSKVNINDFEFVLFDLDNTLYDKRTGPIIEVEKNMDDYVQNLLNLPYDETKRIRKFYFNKYGTTLSGLIKEHNISPLDYLQKVHDIDATKYLSEDKKLQNILKKIKSKKFVLTNSYKKYAQSILKALGISSFFEEVFDITDMNFESKVTLTSYQTILKKISADPNKTIMFDDVWNYLKSAKQLNIFTVLVNNEYYDMYYSKSNNISNTTTNHNADNHGSRMFIEVSTISNTTTNHNADNNIGKNENLTADTCPDLLLRDIYETEKYIK